MVDQAIIAHVDGLPLYQNDSSFYQFVEDQGKATDELSWHSLRKLEEEGDMGGQKLVDAINDESDLVSKGAGFMPNMHFTEENCDLYDNVRPVKWADPEPEKVSRFA